MPSVVPASLGKAWPLLMCVALRVGGWCRERTGELALPLV